MDSLSKKWKRKQKEYGNGPDWTEVINLKIKFDLSGVEIKKSKQTKKNLLNCQRKVYYIDLDFA